MSRFGTKLTWIVLLIVTAAHAANAFYNRDAGRWLNRDPIEERGGLNMYAFVANDGVNSWDLIGLWKINRDSSENWALAERDRPEDTEESLAELLRLDYSEFDKWAKSTAECNYFVPNTVVVYTSKKAGADKLRIPLVNTLRSLAIKSGQRYEAKNYKVLYKLDQSSEEVFKSLWNTDGIFAYAFGGHGADESLGFIAAPGSGSAVGPKEVSPPYHLQAVGAYSCTSANDIIFVTPKGPNETGKWRDLVSKRGTFVGYTADVHWFNVWWNQESVNPGIIPP